MSVLILAEKPSVGRALSSVVGANKTNKGYIEGGGYIVSWCVGHLVGLKNPNEYGCGWEQKWSFSQLPMIPDSWQFKVTESTKDQFGIVTRPEKVTVRAQDRYGNWFEREGEGLTARCFCHEIDHLNGILFTSLAERMLTEEEIQSGEF